MSVTKRTPFYTLLQLPDAMALLWSTRLGWGVLAAVLVMEIIGVVLIRRIVSIDI